MVAQVNQSLQIEHAIGWHDSCSVVGYIGTFDHDEGSRDGVAEALAAIRSGLLVPDGAVKAEAVDGPESPADPKVAPQPAEALEAAPEPASPAAAGQIDGFEVSGSSPPAKPSIRGTVRHNCAPHMRRDLAYMPAELVPETGKIAPRGQRKSGQRFKWEQMRGAAGRGAPLYVHNAPTLVRQVDLDPRHFPGGLTLASEIERLGLDKVETFVVDTPGGGRHFYVEVPEDLADMTSRNNAFGPGVDFIGSDKGVVTAGSVRPDGTYTVHGDPEAVIVPMPEPLVEELRALKRAKAEKVAARAKARESLPEKVPADEIEPCCESLARAKVAEIASALDDLRALPEGARIDLGNGRGEVGWDDGVWRLAADLVEIASWPWTTYTIEDAYHDFFEHAPAAEGTYDPEYKWDRGEIEAGSWYEGDRHRTTEHVTTLDKPVPGSGSDTEATTVREQTRAKVDLRETLAAMRDGKRIEATVGPRSDGLCLFYPKRISLLLGASEDGKTMVAMAFMVAHLQRGETVAMLDWEDNPEGLLGRLLSLGATWDEIESWIEADTLRYGNPEEALNEGDLRDLAEGAVLVVIDAVTESMACLGLNDNHAVDVAKWQQALPKRIARETGAAVVLIDHTNKSGDDPNMATGSQHKKSGIDGVQVRVEKIRDFVPGKGGASRLLVVKDRPGYVRTKSQPLGPKTYLFGTFEMHTSGGYQVATPTEADKPLGTPKDAEAKGAEFKKTLLAAALAVPGRITSRETAFAAVRQAGVTFVDKDARRWIGELRAEGILSAKGWTVERVPDSVRREVASGSLTDPNPAVEGEVK